MTVDPATFNPKGGRTVKSSFDLVDAVLMFVVVLVIAFFTVQLMGMD